MLYVTLSSTRRNERADGKILKYVVRCRTYNQMCKTYIACKYNKEKTHYVHKRFSLPKYNKDTHVIVCDYENIKAFRKGYVDYDNNKVR